MSVRLGELLTKASLITQDQLKEALRVQKETGGKLGETLIKLGFVSEEDITECLSQQFGVRFALFPIDKDNKAAQEQRQWALLDELGIDLIVLARYMQILSPEFTARYPHRIINIHHSFLPAFIGGKPYHRAYERGVKLIGATAHYATGDLDEGPIIEQDVIRTSHRDSVDDLVRRGKDLEKVALARAVKWHIEDRILVYGNKTVVFG